MARHGPRIKSGACPGSRAHSALGRGLVSYSFRLFADFMPIPHAVGNAGAMATINGPTTDHELQATGRFSRLPGRGRPDRPRSGVHAASDAEGWVAINEPTTSHKLQATGHPPCHHTPQTTHHELIGRTHRSAPTTRRSTTRSKGQKLQATSYRPQACFGPGPQPSLGMGKIPVVTRRRERFVGALR